MRNVFSSALLLATLIAGVANAQSAAPPVVIDQGPGWQRFAEPLPESAVAKARSVIGTRSGDPAVRELVLISSRDGLTSAPISAALRDLLEEEFQQSGIASTDPTANLEDPIVVDLALAEAVATGTEMQDFGAYAEPDEPAGDAGAQFLGCYTGWRDSSFDVFDRTLEEMGWDTNDGEEQSNFKLGGNLNFTGRATVTIGYQWKKTSFCVPWIARFKQANVKGFVSMDGSTMDVSFSWAKKSNKRKQWATLFDVNTTVMVGPVPVRFGAQMPFGGGVAINADYTVGAAMTFPFEGTKHFDYVCTLRDRCRSQLTQAQQDTIEFGAAQGVNSGFGASGKVTVKPYVYLEAIGYLYDPRVAHVGIGAEAGLPITLGGANSSVCGAAEKVQGNYLDVTAEVGLYFTYNLVGVADTLGIDWMYDVRFLDLWSVYKTEDIIRGKPAIKVLRRNLLFSRFNEDANISPFTPVVVADGDAGVGVGEPFSFRMRDCVPFKDAVTYQVDWNDGSTEKITEQTDPSTGHRQNLAQKIKNFSTPGIRIVKVTPIKDSAGRNLQETNSGPRAATTERQVVVSKYVAPPTPTSPSLSKSGSNGQTLTVKWGSSTNSTLYRLERETNGVRDFYTTVKVPTLTFTQNVTAKGTYRYFIKACNDYDNKERCSSQIATNPIVVGNPPPPPASVSNVNGRCNGLSTVKWSAVTGATSYKLFASTLNAPGNAPQVYSGTGLQKEVNPPSATYYWVKACNISGCSTFSAYTRTTFYPGCM